jgi:hypothetical protein
MTLYDEMLEIAERDKLPADHILRIRANELKTVFDGDGFPEPKILVGRWARAKRAYSDYTGKPLVDPVVVETGSRLMAFLQGIQRQ